MPTATEANVPPIAPGDTTQPTVAPAADYEARIAALEAEKAKKIEEAANYKAAYLKEKNKNSDGSIEETDEEKMRRIVKETLADSEIAHINREKDELFQKALKENKELKLAQANKTGIPSGIGSHTEGKQVTDTIVTPEQLAAFKARGWSDKDVERYKKNLQKNTR